MDASLEIEKCLYTKHHEGVPSTQITTFLLAFRVEEFHCIFPKMLSFKNVIHICTTLFL